MQTEPKAPLQLHKPEEHSFLIIGQLGAPFGVLGWNHVRSFTQPLKNILQYQKWYIQQKNEWIPFELEAGRVHSKSIVAKLKGIDDRDKAALLTQSHVAIFRSQLPQLEEDEFYWADLEGLQVKTITGEILGNVHYLYDNAGVDVMVVLKENQELHIPFIMQDTVHKVSLEEGCIVVDWQPL